jgi:hypothetical protein
MENKFLNLLPLEFTKSELNSKEFDFTACKNLIELSDAINKRYESYNIYSYIKTEYEGVRTKHNLCIELNFELYIHKFSFNRNIITMYSEMVNNVVNCNISTVFMSIANKKLYNVDSETTFISALKEIVSGKDFFELIDFLIKKSKELNEYYVEYISNNPHLIAGEDGEEKILKELQEEVDKNFKLYEEKFSINLDDDL